jgi:hypothetical protein
MHSKRLHPSAVLHSQMDTASFLQPIQSTVLSSTNDVSGVPNWHVSKHAINVMLGQWSSCCRDQQTKRYNNKCLKKVLGAFNASAARHQHSVLFWLSCKSTNHCRTFLYR